jgi:phosphoglycolate phosphatase-like HAD superfamily hydrolase
MEIKQKECFIPNIVKHFKLQPVSKYVRAAAEFVNLYSKWRGVNRFPALIRTLDFVREWPEAAKRNIDIPMLQPLRDWIERETKLGNPALEAEVERTGDPILRQTLGWSKAVNAAVADMVEGMTPFPFVRESLEKASACADVICVSATPCEALVREWEEHDIAKYARIICGQEMGTKKEHLAMATGGGRYAEGRVLMVGDAPGDMKAARANNALFYPVMPGHEDESWERFHNEALDKFLEGTYAGDYEAALVREFEAVLPEIPPWQK